MENYKTLVQSKSGLRMVSSSETQQSAFGMSEPPWSPDNDFPACARCLKHFDFFTRKHHCRRCGLIFCDGCSKEKVNHPRMCFVDPVRHCRSCALITRRENEFFDKFLKLLKCGSTIGVILRKPLEVNENDVSPYSDTPSKEYSKLTFFPTEVALDNSEYSWLTREWRPVHAKLCPFQRNLILSSVTNPRDEAVKFDLKRLVGVEWASESAELAADGVTTPSTEPTDSIKHSAGNSSRADPQLILTFQVPDKGSSSSNCFQTAFLSLTPCDSDRDRQSQLHWISALRQAGQLIVQ